MFLSGKKVRVKRRAGGESSVEVAGAVLGSFNTFSGLGDTRTLFGCTVRSRSSCHIWVIRTMHRWSRPSLDSIFISLACSAPSQQYYETH